MSDQAFPIFEAHGIVKVFPGFRRGVRALDNVDVVLHRGRSLGIVGESGAGKSTILNVLLGIEAPSTGTVSFHGETLDTGSRAQMARFRREVQVVFQDPKTSLDPRMRVGAIVAEPLRCLKIPGDHATRIREVLDAVGLDPAVVSRYPNEFSGGQRQRIAIARALAPSPTVLIGDEPVSALDVSGSRCSSCPMTSPSSAASATRSSCCRGAVSWKQALPAICSPPPDPRTRSDCSTPSHGFPRRGNDQFRRRIHLVIQRRTYTTKSI